MIFLIIDIKDLVYYVIIIACLLIIAFILLKYWSIKKDEKDQIVVRKIEDTKPNQEPNTELKKEITEEEFPSDLEQVLEKMQNNLNQEKDVTEIFEKEQEEKAIISYQELVRANLKQDINEQIPEERCNLETEIPILDEKLDFLEEKQEKKFKHTGFISPIYGTMDVKPLLKKSTVEEARDIDIEKTLNLTSLSKEKKKNTEFLESLKEFRNNL